MKCKHEWRAGFVTYGCTQDFECVRCGKKERRRFNIKAYRLGCLQHIVESELELAYLKEDK